MAEQYFGATDVGRQRENNEDAFLVQPIWNGTAVAACVIDGVGGYEGGEVAAAIAKTTIESAILKNGGDTLVAMRESFLQANEAIQQQKRESGSNGQMACVLTMAIADLRHNQFWYAHIGDTRLYLLRDDSLIKITKDQSFVGLLEDSGRLTEAEAMKHPKRNEIDKALGFGPLTQEAIETGSSPFLPGDVLLLCSDGLTDLLPAAHMKNILLQATTLQEKVGQLLAAANEAGGKDNITVVLVQNTKKPVKQKAKMPVQAKKEPVREPITGPERKGPEIKPKEAPPNKKAGKAKPLSKENRNHAAVISLSVLCAVLLGGLIYLIWKQYKGSEKEPAMALQKSEKEQRLQQAINTSFSDTLVLDEKIYGSSISLTDTIQINRDSLYITGNTLFLCDSLYKGGGPAFYIGPQCKWIVLDGLQWQNFPVAILAANSNALQLKRASFVHCGITLAYAGNNQDFFHGMWVNTRKSADSVNAKPTRR